MLSNNSKILFAQCAQGYGRGNAHVEHFRLHGASAEHICRVTKNPLADEAGNTVNDSNADDPAGPASEVALSTLKHASASVEARQPESQDGLTSRSYKAITHCLLSFAAGPDKELRSGKSACLHLVNLLLVQPMASETRSAVPPIEDTVDYLQHRTTSFWSSEYCDEKIRAASIHRAQCIQS